MDGSRECNIEESKSSEREVAQFCPTLCDPMDPTRLLCPWNFPGKSTRVDCHFLLQRFPDPGIEAGSPALQADALPSEPPRKHKYINACMWNMKKKWYRQSYLQSRNSHRHREQMYEYQRGNVGKMNWEIEIDMHIPLIHV